MHLFVFYNPLASSRVPTGHMLRLRSLGTFSFLPFMKYLWSQDRVTGRHCLWSVSAASCFPSVLTGQGRGQVRPSPPLLAHLYRSPSSSDTEVPASVCVGDHPPCRPPVRKAREGRLARGHHKDAPSPREDMGPGQAVAAGWAPGIGSGCDCIRPVSRSTPFNSLFLERGGEEEGD